MEFHVDPRSAACLTASEASPSAKQSNWVEPAGGTNGLLTLSGVGKLVMKSGLMSLQLLSSGLSVIF